METGHGSGLQDEVECGHDIAGGGLTSRQSHHRLPPEHYVKGRPTMGSPSSGHQSPRRAETFRIKLIAGVRWV